MFRVGHWCSGCLIVVGDDDSSIQVNCNSTLDDEGHRYIVDAAVVDTIGNCKSSISSISDPVVVGASVDDTRAKQ